MKTLKYTEIGTGKAVRNFRNLCSDGTKWYWIVITTAGGMDVMESDTLDGDGSAVGDAHQDTPSGYSIDTSITEYGFQNYASPYVCPVIRAYGGDLYAACMVYKSGTGVKILLAKRVSGVWTTSIITENTNADFYGGEIFKIGSNFYYQCYYGSTGGWLEIYKWDGTEYKTGLSGKAISGQSDGTYYYYYDSGNVYTFDGTNFAFLEDFGDSGLISNGSPHHSYLIWQNGYKVIGLQQAWYDGSGDKVAYGKQGSGTVVTTYETYMKPNFYYNSVSGQVETKFLIADDDKLYFLPMCGTIALPAQTMCNGGWDGSYDMCTGSFTISKCYTIALESDVETDASFSLDVMRAHSGEWHSQTAPVSGEVKAIYDDADNLVTFLRHGKPIFDGILWNDLNMISPAIRDLDKLVTEDYSDGLLSDVGILADLIAKYGSFIMEGTLASASAYTNRFNFVRRPLWLCLLDICLFNKRIWYLNQGYKLTYNAGTVDSTINIANTDTDAGIQEKSELVNKRSEVTVVGILDLESTETADVLENLWRTCHPSINDQETLDTLATNVIAITNATTVTAVKVLRGNNTTLIPVGETFDLDYNIAPWYLADDSYICMSVLWQNIGNRCTYVGYNAIYWAKWIEEALAQAANTQSKLDADTADLQKGMTISYAGYFKSTAAGNVFKTTADGSTPTGYTERAGYAPTTAVVVASQTTHTKVLKIEHTTNSDYGLMTYTINTDYKTTITVETWIYHSTTSGNFVRFAITATDYSTEGFGIQIQSDGRVQLTNATGGAYANLNQFVLAGWHHYKLIYNSNATSYLFVDGVLCYQQTAWNNSTPKALLLELGVYKATTGTATAYFDAIAFHYETGYVNFMGWADGQLNIPNTPVDPNNPMADGWHLIPYQAAREFNEDTTAAWTNKSVAEYVPSWAKWILLLINAYGSSGGYWYVGVAQGGSGGANAIYCESEGTGASRLIVPVELDASLQFQYYNRSTNKHADYPIFRVIGYK